MNQMNCGSCEAPLDADAIFCNACGAVQTAAISSPAMVVAETSVPTTQCPKCQKMNDSDAKFCSGCAFDFSQLVVKAEPANICPNCGKGFSPTDRFCRHCAFDLTVAAKPSSAVFCTNCGKPFAPTDKFCRSCAADLSNSNHTVGIPLVTPEGSPGPSPTSPGFVPNFSNVIQPIQPTVSSGVTQVAGSAAETATETRKPTGTQWISPSLAAFALICFFLPWVEVSCSAFGSRVAGRSASGADLAQFDGSLWFLPLLAIVIIVLFFAFKMQDKLANARPFIAIAAGIALVFLAFKAINVGQTMSGAPSLGFGDEWRTGLDIRPEFGVFGVIIGFLGALVGAAVLVPINTVSNSPERMNNQNVISAASYGLSFILGILWIPVPIFFLLKEPYKQNPSIRFHSFQSLLLVVLTFVITVLIQIASAITQSSVLAIAALGIAAGSIGINVFCIWKAYQNEDFRLPVVGDWAMNLATKGTFK